MPASAAKLLDLLGQTEASQRMFSALGEKGRLKPGTQLPPPQGVFPRWVDPEAEAAKQQPAPQKQAKQKKT
jgi:methionyl-tRNA synthetase